MGRLSRLGATARSSGQGPRGGGARTAGAPARRASSGASRPALLSVRRRVRPAARRMRPRLAVGGLVLVDDALRGGLVDAPDRRAHRLVGVVGLGVRRATSAFLVRVRISERTALLLRRRRSFWRLRLIWLLMLATCVLCSDPIPLLGGLGLGGAGACSAPESRRGADGASRSDERSRAAPRLPWGAQGRYARRRYAPWAVLARTASAISPSSAMSTTASRRCRTAFSS